MTAWAAGRRGAFGLLAAVDLAAVVYAVLGPALVVGMFMTRYLVVAVLVAFGVVLRPFLSFGNGAGTLPPPWQLDLGPPVVVAVALVAACLSAAAATLCLLQAHGRAPRLRLAAMACSALGLLVTAGGSWLR